MGLIVDSFAGGGGASTGIEWALGRPVDIAINHDMESIRMHKANHPLTKHYCEDVWEVDPIKATKGRSVDLFWLSPDCKHFSKAKGGKPLDNKIRGLAWIAVKWAKAVKPKVIILENVEEFQTWGPLDSFGMPCKRRRGQTFYNFKEQLRDLGYTVDYRELRACDYGAPTSRKRLYMICALNVSPTWPDPTHGAPEDILVRTGLLKPWRTAAEIIDWSIPCPSIFDRKKPLVENTLRRIARGLEKFVVNNPDPFIMQAYGGGYTGAGRSIHEPLPTITTKDHNYLVTPYITQYHSYSKDEVRGQELTKPLLTVDTSNRYSLITPYMIPRGDFDSKRVSQVQAFLIKYYGQGYGQDIRKPLDTITTKDRFGLVTVHGKPYQIVDIGMRMLQPRELFRAQGFPDTYIIDVDYEGNVYPKTQQVARVGNSVVPQMAQALVGANKHLMTNYTITSTRKNKDTYTHQHLRGN